MQSALNYGISLVIRQSFFSYKTDLDIWDCLERVKIVLDQNFTGPYAMLLSNYK